MIEFCNPPIKRLSRMVISAVPAMLYTFGVILKYVSRSTSYLPVRLAFHLHYTPHRITMQR